MIWENKVLNGVYTECEPEVFGLRVAYLKQWLKEDANEENWELVKE